MDRVYGTGDAHGFLMVHRVKSAALVINSSVRPQERGVSRLQPLLLIGRQLSEAVGECIRDSRVHASRLEVRNCTHHEFVEQRNRKGHVAVRRAVDHALPDQLRSNWTPTRHLHTKPFRAFRRSYAT